MDLKRLQYKVSQFSGIREEMLKAKEYYKNNTDILYKGVVPNNDEADPLRKADNRIVHNFHEILVDEKASYMFTYPVLIDVDNNKEINEKVTEILGDDYTRKIKNLAIEASNCGRAWLHYWIEENKEDITIKQLKYAMVDSEQVIPIYSNGLERELEGVIRNYTCYEYVDDRIEEQPFSYLEYWTKDSLIRYKFNGTTVIGSICDMEEINHTLGDVPFIEFANNGKKHSDLSKYKKQIDLYERVMSGFANDLEDIQQVIYILENYGGENLKEFLGDLKRYKAIKTETSEGGGGVKTLQIDIPVEARKVLLEQLKKQIYESGQGLQQDVESVGNASGVALKFFYRKLDIKSGLLETEFRSSINKFIRVILKFLGITEYKKISQTYTRNRISNDLEDAQIAQNSAGTIPKKLILRNHPWVDDVEEAIELLKEEEASTFENYNDIFGKEDDIIDE